MISYYDLRNIEIIFFSVVTHSYQHCIYSFTRYTLSRVFVHVCMYRQIKRYYFNEWNIPLLFSKVTYTNIPAFYISEGPLLIVDISPM